MLKNTWPALIAKIPPDIKKDHDFIPTVNGYNFKCLKSIIE